MAKVIIKTGKIHRYGNSVTIEGHTVKFDHEGKTEVEGIQAKEILANHPDVELIEGELPADAPVKEIGSDPAKELNKLKRDELVSFITKMYEEAGKAISIPDSWTKANIIEMIQAGVEKEESNTPLTREDLAELKRPELLALLADIEKAKGLDVTEFVDEQTESEIIDRIIEVTEDASND